MADVNRSRLMYRPKSPPKTSRAAVTKLMETGALFLGVPQVRMSARGWF
jgi:hypothetical protein